MIQTNVASLSTYCVRVCKIKHFTEREFSGIFSLAGGILRFQNGNSRWPWCVPWWQIYVNMGFSDQDGILTEKLYILKVMEQ